MLVIYLDESGALNNVEKERYFVISAMATATKQHRKTLSNLGRKLHVTHCIPRNLDEIHASDLDFPAKQDILSRMNELGCFVLDYIVVDKKYIKPLLFKEKNICYNFLVAQLLKKIMRVYKEPMQILLDNHTIKAGSLNSLRDYIVTEARAKWNFEYEIDLNLIDSKQCKCIQLIDVVSNAIYAKYNYGKRHLYDLSAPNYRFKIKFPFQKFGQS